MSVLFSPFKLRDVTFKNRIAVPPMSQYRAKDGEANDWHLVHLGRFALGGAGLVFAEATAVEKDGRRTHGDLGLWYDTQIDHLRPVTSFLAREGQCRESSSVMPAERHPNGGPGTEKRRSTPRICRSAMKPLGPRLHRLPCPIPRVGRHRRKCPTTTCSGS